MGGCKVTRKLGLLALLAVVVVGLVLVGCKSEDQEKDAEKAPLTFIQFYDPECPFCQEMEPIVEDLKSEYEPKIDKFEIINVKTSEGMDKVEEFGVFLTPTFVLLNADGDEMDRINGAAKKEDMIDFIDRGISDVQGEEGGGSRMPVEGEGTTLQ